MLRSGKLGGISKTRRCRLPRRIAGLGTLLPSAGLGSAVWSLFSYGMMPTVQEPAWHAAPAGHTVPQAPQLFGSVAVSVQVPLQLVSPATGQLHPPSAQTSPAAHCTPQRPQLFGSVARSVQVPLQFTSPAVEQVQTPSAQMSPAGHTTPQAPQLFTSVARSVQTERAVAPPKQQSVSPAEQTASLCWATCAATAGCPTVIS
jgi:hypothetical protein